MQIFKYFPYTKTINSIICGFRLYEGDGDGGGGSDGNSNTGDGNKGSAGSGKPGGSDGNKNTVTKDSIPQAVFQEVYNMGFAKADAKSKLALEKKLVEMGITEESLVRWKKSDEDAEKNKTKVLEEKGEFDKLKIQMVDQHEKKVSELDGTIQKREGTIHKLVVRNKIIAEAAVECVNPSQVADLLEGNFKAEEINGEWVAVPYNGELKLVDDKGEPQTVKTFIENWLKLEENSYHKKSSVGTGGTGSKGTGTGYQKDGKNHDRKFRTPQGAIREGLKSGSSKILNRKTVLNKDDGNN